MADISKIILPSGSEYSIKDTVAREAISGGITFIVATDATNTPKNVTWHKNGALITGTLEANDSQIGAFYLVLADESQEINIYKEYIAVGNIPSKSWEKLGDTQIVGLNKTTTNVLGANATFSDPGATATVSGGTTDVVLGENTSFALSSGIVSVGTSTHHIKATASGTTVEADGTAAAITGFGTHSTDTFVKSVSAETGKNLDTTTITGVSGSTTASKASAGTSKSIASAGSAITVGDGTTTISTTNTDILKGASVSNEALILGACTLDTTSVTPAVANGTITPYTFSNVTVPIAEANATTVATGTTSISGTGSAVVTDVTIGSSGSAITQLGTPTTANALTGVTVTTQPTVTITEGTSTDYAVTTPTGSGSVGTQITVGTEDKVTTVKTIGTISVPSHSITVSNKDQQNVIKDVTIQN